MYRFSLILSAAALAFSTLQLSAQPIAITNPGFEDVTGLTVYNEFNFGIPAGWLLYDPSSVSTDSGTYIGTLRDPQVAFFSESAPDGSRVLILFNANQQGAGAYGVQQTTSEVIQANRRYELTVQVGDIDSGTAIDTTFYNLEGFPGYRLELLADSAPGIVGGEDVLTSDSVSLNGILAEGFFEPATVSFTVPNGHPSIGQQLGVRLLSLNQSTGLVPEPDNEVDFDSVSLTAITISRENEWSVLD
ncbi:MAG: hypothetical protein SFY68_03395 [Candidatus Sumerlaeia bacterium]|nr:hypothetical protein [Candidatus Sumerlaeia bacterium]